MCVYTYIYYFFEGIRVSKAIKSKRPRSKKKNGGGGRLRGSISTFVTAFSLTSFLGSLVAAETSES